MFFNFLNSNSNTAANNQSPANSEENIPALTRARSTSFSFFSPPSLSKTSSLPVLKKNNSSPIEVTSTNQHLPLQRAASLPNTSNSSYFDVTSGVTDRTKDLRAAIERASLSTVQTLLRNGVDPSWDNQVAIRAAVLYNRVDIVKCLMSDPRVDPSAERNFCIRVAATRGYSEMVKILLADSRIDPSEGETWAERDEAIKNAARMGYAEILRDLLSHPKVDPAADNNFAIRVSCANGHLEAVRVLLSDKRVDPCASGEWYGEKNEALRQAQENGHNKIVELLMHDNRLSPKKQEPQRIVRHHHNNLVQDMNTPPLQAIIVSDRHRGTM